MIELNRRYDSPLPNKADLLRYYDLLNGHPSLLQRGLYEMKHCRLSLWAFEELAARDDGLFGDHLRGLLVWLAGGPALAEAVRTILCR